MATYNVNQDLVLGDELFLYIVSGETATPIAFATSCAIQVDGETIDTSNKMSGRWNSNLGGKNGYTVTSDALYTQVDGHYSFDSLFDLMLSVKPNNLAKWKVGRCKDVKAADFDLDTSKAYYSGEGYITSLSLNAGNNEVASSSITITGSGAIEINKPA